MSSEAFAQLVEQWNFSGKSRVNLVIGGFHGLSKEVRGRAITVSPFPHQVAVLILIKQLYRGFKILKGNRIISSVEIADNMGMAKLGGRVNTRYFMDKGDKHGENSS